MLFYEILNFIKIPFIQVAIPLFITSIIFLILMVLRKHFRLTSIVPNIITFVLTVVLVFLGLNYHEKSKGAYDYLQQSQNNKILMNELLLEGNYELAEQIANDLSKEEATNPEYTLIKARIKILQGNNADGLATYKKAKNDYQNKGVSEFPEEEYKSVEDYYTTQYQAGKDTGMIAYLTSQDKNPEDYGFSTITSLNNIKLEDLYEVIDDNVSESQDKLIDEDETLDQLNHVADLIAETEEVYNQYLSSGEFDEKATEKLERKLSTAVEENPRLLGNKYVRLARLKGMILNESYKKIAEAVSEYSSTEELMIVSELYLSGHIKDSYFNEEYITIDENQYQSVIDQCNIVVNGALSEESKSVRKEYKENLKRLDLVIDNKALITTQNHMLDDIGITDPSLRSKEYLQLAKIEQYLDMPTKANEYISQSISLVGDSTDMSYAQPMYELVGIISGTSKNGTEDVKNVAQYVNQVIHHSLPYQIIQPKDSEDRTEEKDDIESSQNFEQFLTNVVSEKMATINIGSIDKSNFSTVRARIQVESDSISSLEDFKNEVTITDCNRKITDYTVEKLEYEKSRIILLCDVSGSMEYNVDDLKYAITSFAENMESKEEISVVGFDDVVVFDTGFTTNPEDVKQAADKIGAYGGTNMYSALLQASEKFTSDVNINNIIILMTDGMDNDLIDEATVNNTLGALVANKAFTVYTLGLGTEVDTTYLEMLARVGNGSFIYVPDSISLDNFFNFVHQQTNNQYVISYEAKNKTLNKRTLKVEIPKEHVSKEKTYYLVDPEPSDNLDHMDSSIITEATAKVNGLKSKVVYKSDVETINYLNGEGFQETDEISLRIKGDISYNLGAEFLSSTSYQVVIPYGLAIGTYDLEVTFNDEIFTLENELTIAIQGTEKYVKFGDYSFTCSNSYVDSNSDTVLTGNVIMNGWLYFKGDVTLSGDIDHSDRLQLTDTGGAYISYNSATSTGLAKFLANKGVSMSLGKLGSFHIFKEEYDPSEYADFPVEAFYDTSMININFLMIQNAEVCLYPDMVHFKNAKLYFDFPFQEELIGKLPDDIQKVDYDTGWAANATSIGVDASFSYEAPEEEAGKEVRLAVMPLWLNELEAKINTYTNNYSLLMKVKLKAFNNMESMGFDFTVLDGKFDGATIYADIPVTLQRAPVPISLSDLSLGFSGCSKWQSKDISLKNILATTIKAGFKADIAKVTDVLPKVADFLEIDPKKDVVPPVISLTDCTLEATLAELDFSFEANLNFLDLFEFGKAEINMGRFSYSNELLGLRSTTQTGLRANLKLGHSWKTSNCKLDLYGNVEAVIGYPYTGLSGGVDGAFEAKWWIFKVNEDFAGDLLIGLQENSYGQAQFNAILRGGKNGNYIGFRVYISQAEGFNVDAY